MSVILVEICCGTTCHVMGGGDLEELASHLPAAVAGKVEIAGCRCLGQCRDGAFGRAPFVRIAGQIHDQMDLARAVELTVAAVQAAGRGNDVR